MALRAVANERKCVVLEVFLRALVKLPLGQDTYMELVPGPVGAFYAVRQCLEVLNYVPKTVSFVPAKSIVFRPLDC